MFTPFSIPFWMRVAGSWSFHLWLTCTFACVCMCVCLCPPVCPLPMLRPRLLPRAPVHSTFYHPYAGLPVLLLCVLAAVHPNMALLPTGITSVRSASTRSRATVWPWGTTRHSRRRKLPRPGWLMLPGDHLARLSGCSVSELILWEGFSMSRANMNLLVFLCVFFPTQHDIERSVWKEEKRHVGPWTVSTGWAEALFPLLFL